MSRAGPGIGATFVLLVAVAFCVRAPADDDRVVEQREAAPVEGEVVFGGNVRLIGVRQPIQYDLGRMFDQQAFGRSAGPVPGGGIVVINGAVVRPQVQPPSVDPPDGLAAVRHRGERHVAAIERICRLDDAQVRRLRVALESDLKRLAGVIAAVRSRYAGGTTVATPQDLDRELLATLRADAQACRQRIETALGPGSLLAAVSRAVLTPPQDTAFEAWLAERRLCRWRAMVGAVLVQLDESGLGLSQRQFTALEESLVSDVPQLEVLREATGTAVDAQFARFQGPLVLSRLGRRPEGWRPSLDPRQQARLDGLIEQAGDPAAIEQLLVSQGILEENAP